MQLRADVQSTLVSSLERFGQFPPDLEITVHLLKQTSFERQAEQRPVSRQFFRSVRRRLTAYLCLFVFEMKSGLRRLELQVCVIEMAAVGYILLATEY